MDGLCGVSITGGEGGHNVGVAVDGCDVSLEVIPALHRLSTRLSTKGVESER